MGFPSEWNMHAMHAYACRCMNICSCISPSTYAFIAYACKYICAWHACTYICMHGMYAYMHPSCHVHLHTTPTGGRHLPMGGALPRYILCAPPLSTPHPTGEWEHQHEGGTIGPLDIYISTYSLLMHCIHTYTQNLYMHRGPIVYE